MGIKCFFLEQSPSGLFQYSLRRYTYSSDPSSPLRCVNNWGHEAEVDLGRHPASFAPDLHEGKPTRCDRWPHDDSRWPTTCSRCAYTFTPEDEWQFVGDDLFRKHGTEEDMTIRSSDVGAMWFADWMLPFVGKPTIDGHVLAVRLPGKHDWYCEQTASNCDSPCKHCNKTYNQHVNTEGKYSGRCQPSWTYNDGNPHYEDAKPHFCWIRHGTPPHQVVHVDKSGITCGAGAGSIVAGGWHGFLHNGELVG